jgi:hypothetical protein
MSSSERHFTVVIGNKEHGLYISSTPSSAARKAVSKLCTNNKNKKVEFFMREITQGSQKKTYGPYLGEIKKLDKPIELKGRVIGNSTTETSKKVRNILSGGMIQTDGHFEVADFIYPKQTYNPISIFKIKKNKYRKDQKCFFIIPEEYDHKNVIYKYAIYYSNKHNKPRVKFINMVTHQIDEINIEEIPNDKDGYKVLTELVKILENNSDQSPDFRTTVKRELNRRPKPKIFNKVTKKSLEPFDFIFPLENIDTYIATKTKSNQIYFFIKPEFIAFKNGNGLKVLYKYAIYYNNTLQKPMVITINNHGIFEELRNIGKIPNDPEGYEVLERLKLFLSKTNFNNRLLDFKVKDLIDFIEKVNKELRTREHPYVLQKGVNMKTLANPSKGDLYLL